MRARADVDFSKNKEKCEMPDVKVENQRTGRDTGEMQRSERSGGILRRGEQEHGVTPFSLMRRLSDELDRAFATSFGLPAWGRGAGGSEEYGLWAPTVEVRQEEGNLIVTAELPGINKDNVKVELTQDGLMISGERRREHEEKRQGFYRSERSYGRFQRMVPLPDGVDAEKAKAQFKDGMLEVQIPLPESMQRRNREIPIKT
jgi:HSP20 family protein